MQGHICLPQGKDTTQNTREVPVTKDTNKGVLNMERSLKPTFKNRRKGCFVDHRGREVCVCVEGENPIHLLSGHGKEKMVTEKESGLKTKVQ